MRRLNRIIILLLIGSFSIFADDFSFDDFSFDEEDGSTGGSVASALEFNGTVDLGTRAYFGDDITEDEADIDTSAVLTLKYRGSMADLTVSTDLSYDSIDLDEAYTNIYFDKFNVEAGVYKTVWGKGDKLHVVDLLNPMDYSEYFLHEYLENKIAQPTLKVNIPMGMSGLIELAYIPVFEGDTIPVTGRWATSDSSALYSAITSYALTPADVITAAGVARLQTLSDTSYYYEDTNSLEYGQFGFRGTVSVSGFDLGALYYFGFNKRPTVPAVLGKGCLKYERMHMAGIEIGKALGGFNLRGEAAYYIMDESDNSINYLAGFDYYLPIHNLNFNIQLKGNYLIDSDYDNENMLVGKLSDNFDHEKKEVAVTGIYYIEDECFMIKPEFSTQVGDSITLEFVTAFFEGDKGTIFGDYDSNDYISLNINYMF